MLSLDAIVVSTSINLRYTMCSYWNACRNVLLLDCMQNVLLLEYIEKCAPIGLHAICAPIGIHREMCSY